MTMAHDAAFELAVEEALEHVDVETSELRETVSEVLEMTRDVYAPMSLFAQSRPEVAEELFFYSLAGIVIAVVAHTVYLAMPLF